MCTLPRPGMLDSPSGSAMLSGGLLQLRAVAPGAGACLPVPSSPTSGRGIVPLGGCARFLRSPAVRRTRARREEPALVPVLVLGLVLRLGGGGPAGDHGPGVGQEGDDEEPSRGLQESQLAPARQGKGGVGRGKGGVGRGKLGPGRAFGKGLPPPGDPASASHRASAEEGTDGPEPGAARSNDDGANAVMADGGGIEERVREMEQAKAAKRGGAAARQARRRTSSGSTRRSSAGMSQKLAERLAMNDEARLSGQTRPLRERHAPVNYEEASESDPPDDWSPAHSGMSMSDEAAEVGGGTVQRRARAVKSRGTSQAKADLTGRGGGRRRRGLDKDANPLGQELSGSGEEGGGDGELEDSEEAREERRKRRLEEEAEEAAEDAEGADGDVHKRYRSFRRKMVREFWGESPEPPPEPRREYTFEEVCVCVCVHACMHACMHA